VTGPPPDRSEALAALVGRPSGPVSIGRDTVDANMIRHWCEAMGDENPVYRTDAAARAVGLPGLIAPPTMVQAWIMTGLAGTQARERARAAAAAAPLDPGASPQEQMMALFDEEGLTSVVATNCEQEYVRPLVPGERVLISSVIEAISDRKQTALGEGRFATSSLRFVAVPDESVGDAPDPAELAASGDLVATMTWRIFKFAPKPPPPASDTAADRPGVRAPPLTEDNAFFFEGARRHELLIQRCADCGLLRHPPSPACARCRSFAWDAVAASGRGQVYSFVVVHHPQVRAFDYPLPIALVELEEGTRLVAELVGVEPAAVEIGTPVAVEFVDHDEELTVPVFRPVGSS